MKKNISVDDRGLTKTVRNITLSVQTSYIRGDGDEYCSEGDPFAFQRMASCHGSVHSLFSDGGLLVFLPFSPCKFPDCDLLRSFRISLVQHPFRKEKGFASCSDGSLRCKSAIPDRDMPGRKNSAGTSAVDFFRNDFSLPSLPRSLLRYVHCRFPCVFCSGRLSACNGSHPGDPVRDPDDPGGLRIVSLKRPGT